MSLASSAVTAGRVDLAGEQGIAALFDIYSRFLGSSDRQARLCKALISLTHSLPLDWRMVSVLTPLSFLSVFSFLYFMLCDARGFRRLFIYLFSRPNYSIPYW